MNKRGTWGDLFLILLVIFLIVLIALVVNVSHNKDKDQCKTICIRKGLDYYQIGTHYRRCECLSDGGDVILVNR